MKFERITAEGRKQQTFSRKIKVEKKQYG